MPRDLPLGLHTIAADLMQRSLDAHFDEQFPENGSFTRRTVKSRDYFYYQGYERASGDNKGKRTSLYVGPADDPDIAGRVERFKAIKQSRKVNSSLVMALGAAGIPRPPIVMGRVIEALARAGVFRLRGVLVGTAAYQTYPLLLGQYLSEAAAITQDVDIAQFRSISLSVDDSTGSILEELKTVDTSFRAVPSLEKPLAATAFENSTGFRIDVLTPNRSSDDLTGKPMALPALTDAHGEPLRFLDYLIYRPVRSVVLHGPGVAVTVPQPARYAIHKIIISERRLADMSGNAKARKDRVQAGEILLALKNANQFDLCEAAAAEAMERGPQWRSALAAGAAKLSVDAKALIAPLLSTI